MSILRSGKFVKYIGNLARNIHVSQTGRANGFSPNINHAYFQPKNYATAVAATQRDNNSLNRSIRRLDEDARRVGRISRKELEEVIQEIQLTKSATSSQSLLLIRCCGNLVPEETPEFRTKLVSNVWNTLEKLGIPMDVSHYNALLRVYLENEHQFSPVEFLSELERKGIEPNRVTYQRLVASYCQTGDIEGATRILEFMREKQMPISEGVFNALILGHAKAGDMTSAQGILGVMGQAGLEPNSDTYATLLCGFAITGDAESIERVLKECEQKEIYLGDRDYLEIVFTLAINNHDQLVDSVLKRINKTFGYNQDAANVILRLTTRGKESVAYQLYQTMVPQMRNNERVSTAGGFFIKQLAKANRPVSSILRICEEMKENNTNPRGLLIATETALQAGNVDLSLDLIKAMQDNFYPIRSHYFWPILAVKGKNNGKDVLDVLKKMTEMKVHPNSQTLREYVFPYLLTDASIKDLPSIISYLKECNVSIGLSVANCVAYLLIHRKIKAAADVASTYPAMYNGIVPLHLLSSSLIETQDLDSFGTLVHAMIQVTTLPRNEENEATEEETVFDEREYVGRILLDVISKRNSSISIINLLQKFLDLGLGISNSTAEQIQLRLNDGGLTAEVSTLLSKLVSADLTPAPIERKMPSKFVPKNEDALRAQLQTLQAKGDSGNNVKRQLFTYYCAVRDCEKAEAYKKELEAEGFVFQTGMYAVLLEMYLNLNLLEKAFEVHSVLLEREPDIQLDNIKAVKLATGLVQADRLQDAIEFLKKQERNVGEVDKEKEKDKPFLYSSACWRLLNTVAEKGDVQGVKLLFDTLLASKFIEVTNIYLGPLVKAHLVNDDLKSALDVFEWCCQNHRATPFKNELTCKLIQKEDAVFLQRLTDLSTSVHGEINSLHDLIISFVECGRIRQARKILETPGLRVRTERLSSAGERYQSEGLIEPLEGLIKATKDIAQVDHGALYFQLLNSYIKTDDVDKALGVWMQMQDEDVQPSEKFLFTLGNYLKEKNQSVPFIIPDYKKPSTLVPGQTISTSHRGLWQALNSENWTAVVNSYNELNHSGGKLSAAEVIKLIELAMKNVSLEEVAKIIQQILVKGDGIPRGKLYYFTKSLALTGNIEAFENFGNFLTEEQRINTKYNNLVCNCYIKAGKTEELLNKLENDLKKANTDTEINHLGNISPVGGMVGLLNAHPELRSRVESLSDQYASKGITTFASAFWTYYALNNDTEAANAVFAKHLKSSPKFLFKILNNSARSSGNETTVDYLIETLKSYDHVTPKDLGFACSTKLNILAEMKDYQRASSFLEEIIKTVPIENLSIPVLRKVKELAERTSSPFPYTIPERSKNTREDETSSDSDDDVKPPKKSVSSSGQHVS